MRHWNAILKFNSSIVIIRYGRILYKRVREKGTTEKKRKETIETFQHFTRRTAVFVLALFWPVVVVVFSVKFSITYGRAYSK